MLKNTGKKQHMNIRQPRGKIGSTHLCYDRNEAMDAAAEAAKVVAAVEAKKKQLLFAAVLAVFNGLALVEERSSSGNLIRRAARATA